MATIAMGRGVLTGQGNRLRANRDRRPHLHRTLDLNDVFGTPVIRLSAAQLLGAAIASDNPDEEVVLVVPDE